VDAIGGSSAGVIVNNKIMVASLFRAVPAERFDEAKVFSCASATMARASEVVNDGDVTGARGVQCRSKRMACSGSRWVQPWRLVFSLKGGMTGWLSELAFAPLITIPRPLRTNGPEIAASGPVFFTTSREQIIARRKNLSPRRNGPAGKTQKKFRGS